MGHFSIGFLVGLAAGVYAAQEYDLPKAKFLYSLAVEKFNSTESELRKKSDEASSRKS